MSVTAQSFFIAHGFGNGLAQSDADIFNGVMPIDVQVTLGLDVQIDEAMACNLIEHVVKKTNARRQVSLAGAVQIDFDSDLGFCSVARDFCNAGCTHKDSLSAANMCAFSAGVPTVRRKQLVSNGCILETFLTKMPFNFIPSKHFVASGIRTKSILA